MLSIGVVIGDIVSLLQTFNAKFADNYALFETIS